MTSGTVVAIAIIKLAAGLGITTAIITGVSVFNKFELKDRKTKGGSRYGSSSDTDQLYEKIKSKY